jgi:hypothetical protein
MTTHPVYDILLDGITDEMEKKVIRCLINHAGERVTREQMVLEVHGIYVQKNALASSTEDRQNREIIERLQEHHYPIISSSAQAGYILGAEDKELDDYLTELSSRRARLDEKISKLKASRRWLPLIREWIANRPVMQDRLF